MVISTDVESSFKHQRSLRDYPYKKRKIYDCGSVGNSDGGKSIDGMCTSLTRGYNGVKSSNGLCTTPNEGYNGDASSYCLTLPTGLFSYPYITWQTPEVYDYSHLFLFLFPHQSY